jgi:hypothetical protein
MLTVDTGQSMLKIAHWEMGWVEGGGGGGDNFCDV